MSARKRAPKAAQETTTPRPGRKRQKLRQISVRAGDDDWAMCYATNAKLGEVEKKNLSFNYTFLRAMSELYERLHGKPYRA